MNFRELHNVECIEVPINGAGDYYIPRPQFADKKIDSIFIWDGNSNMYNQNLYLSVYSIEKKPLYINIPGVELVFDNLNNRINETIDFDLFKITYTGELQFILNIYFSIGEKIISQEEYFSATWNCKNLHINILDRIPDKEIGEYKLYYFTANEADFLRGRKVRVISNELGQLFALNLSLKSGQSMKNILNPFFHQSPTPIAPYANLFPFLMNDEIDLDNSYIALKTINQYYKYIDLTFFYE